MNVFRIGFLLAEIANAGGILFFSKFFTNPAMVQANPVVMSNFEQHTIRVWVWGFAYISVMNSYESVPWWTFRLTRRGK